MICSKDSDGTANIVDTDTDQTAPLGAVWSGSALFAQTYQFHYLKFLWELGARMSTPKMSAAL